MKTALIGLGRMGARHAVVIRQCGLDLAAVCDVNAENLAKVGEEFGVAEARRFNDPFALIEKVRPELLVIATTAPSHHGLVLAAAKAGVRKILCEKPMGTSLAECSEMLAACKASGTQLAINHQMRFMEQYVVPKDLVESDAFGGLSSVTVTAGNFGMAMNGTHYFEMFRFLTGESAVKVNAWFGGKDLPNPRGPQFRDASGSVRLETASGKRFYMDCSADQGHGMHVTYMCRNGRIDVDELSGVMSYVVRHPEHREQPTVRYGMPYETVSRTIAPADAVAPTKSVLDALLAGENYPSGEVGMLAMQLLIAAHLSHRQGGKTVDLRAESLPQDLVLPVA